MYQDCVCGQVSRCKLTNMCLAVTAWPPFNFPPPFLPWAFSPSVLALPPFPLLSVFFLPPILLSCVKWRAVAVLDVYTPELCSTHLTEDAWIEYTYKRGGARKTGELFSPPCLKQLKEPPEVSYLRGKYVVSVSVSIGVSRRRVYEREFICLFNTYL